jgi:hypothetical protein
MLTFRISPGKSTSIPSSDAAEAGLNSFPKKEYRKCGELAGAFPRRKSPGYAARQSVQVEKTMKPLPRYSPLIHPLVSHAYARLFTWHTVAILVVAAWALQLIHFAMVIVRWRLGNAAKDASRASDDAKDGRICFYTPAENEAWSETRLRR